MIDTTLGPYEIKAELGSGGMGTVYLAETAGGNGGPNRVALKLVHPHLLRSPGVLDRFQREARIGRRVRHENVVRTLDCDCLEGHHLIVMEHVVGQTLRELQDELQRVPEDLCRHIGVGIGRGLAAIHAAGVVHRDLKPDNVLITPDHIVKIMDLGLAQLSDELTRLTRSGEFLGSLLYAAPEQFRAGELDARTDLYAAGLVLYELACGVHPHPGSGFGEILKSVLDSDPAPLGRRNPQVSAFFEEVVHTLLAREPESRLGSAAELAGVLTDGEESAWWRRRALGIRARTRRPPRRVRIPRATAMHGREAELGTLVALYRQAKSGEGRVVLVEGEAGIGKSRLVHELVGRLESEGETLHFLRGSHPPAGAATATDAFAQAFRSQFGDAGSEAYLARSPLLVRRFDALLRGEPPPGGEAPLDRAALQAAFAVAARAVAAERPLILVTEDLHFAPADGLALFASMALAAAGHPLLLIGTTRPGLPAAWTAGIESLEHATRLALERLGAEDLAALLEEALRSRPLANELVDGIARKSDGNPFFVLEILRTLRERSLIRRRTDGAWSSAGRIGELEVPSTVLGLVRARIDALDDEQRELLEAASCCGFEFDPGLLAGALARPPIPVLRALGRLERAHRIVRAAGRRFRFDHHQVHEALYAAISEPLREQYHVAIAEALVARNGSAGGGAKAEICEHFLRGAAGERAEPYLLPALDHLDAAYRIGRAVRLAGLALGIPGLLAGEERARLLVRKAQQHDILGERSQQQAALAEARTLADTIGGVSLRAHVGVTEGTLLARRAEYAAAAERLEEALALAREADDTSGEAEALGNLGTAYWFVGRYDDAIACNRRHLALARELGDRKGESRAIGNLGVTHLMLGRFDEATELSERWLEMSRRSGDARAAAHALGNLGVALSSTGRHAEARERFAEQLELARKVGDRECEGRALGNLANEARVPGRMEEAREMYERHLLLAREIGDKRSEAATLGNLGTVSRDLGRLDEARDRLRQQAGLAGSIGDRHGEGVARANLGSLEATLGQPGAALTEYRRSLEIARELSAAQLEGFVLGGMGQLALQQGDLDEARRRIGQALAGCRERNEKEGVASALLALAEVAERAGETKRAIGLCDDVLELAPGLERTSLLVAARILRAGLPGGDVAAALEAFHDQGGPTGKENQVAVRYDLWQLTGDPAHLEEAKRLLDELHDHAPPECRESILECVPAHRGIVEAWGARSGARDRGREDSR